MLNPGGGIRWFRFLVFSGGDVTRPAVYPTRTIGKISTPFDGRKPGGNGMNITTENTIEYFFNNTYRPLKLRGRSANTVRLYGCLFRQLQRHLHRRPIVADLNELTIAGYLMARADAGRSPYTVEKERCQLMALGRLAHARGLLPVAPVVQPTIMPERVPHAWTIDQLRRLFHAADNMAGTVYGCPAGLWWGALIRVAWETSERIGALLAVERHHLAGTVLVVPASARKGGRRERIYHLSQPVAAHVAAVLAHHDKPRIFPWERSKTYLWNRFRLMKKNAGLPPGRRLAFHQIRRSAASWYAHAGGDAAKFLGHSSPRITEKWYLDPRIADTAPAPCDVLPNIDQTDRATKIG